MTKKFSQYEAMFLLGAAAATSEQDAGVGLCRSIIERHGGQVLVIKKWDERKLAYEMGKNKRGTYVIAFFKAAGPAISAIERDVNLSEDVLRVIVLKADHLNETEMNAVEPQPIQPREERNPWDRPGFNDPPRRDDRAPRDDRPREKKRDEPETAAAAKD